MDNIIFFDAECPLCHRAVRHIIQIDPKRLFLFAPLKGPTASKILTGPNAKYTKMNTLVLLENYQSTDRHFSIRSRAIFRIYWLLGGLYALPGLLSFLPCALTDLIYRTIANHRHQFKLKPHAELGPHDRFLE